ncbi:MAG: flagellar basal body protein, partial [Oscillospiraceae bacterium]
MLRSTFYSFTTASRALAINQKSLDTVGQNISNLGTAGYTRQRVDRYSVASSKGGLYGSSTDMNVGQGVEMSTLS